MDHHRESLMKMVGLEIKNAKVWVEKMNTAMKKKKKKSYYNHTTISNFIEKSQNI